MSNKTVYTTQLQAGLGLIDNTKVLLEIWTTEMTVPKLYQTALESGRFHNITARRLRNIIVECFAPRYLINNGATALHLKQLLEGLSQPELQQLLLLFTCRASPILGDFIRQVYWEKYAGGNNQVSREDAQTFIVKALNNGKMIKPWSETTIRRVSGYLTGCCADYGMLENGSKTSRRILPFRAYPKITAYLAYDLHFAGLGDNALLGHEDWGLFGFNRQDTLAEIKQLSLKGFFIVQAAGDVVKISWKYQNMEALCNVLTQN